MSALVPIHFESADVRMFIRDGEPWWVLMDIAPVLGLSNPSKLASRLESYQKDNIPERDVVGRRKNLIIVSVPS